MSQSRQPHHTIIILTNVTPLSGPSQALLRVRYSRMVLILLPTSLAPMFLLSYRHQPLHLLDRHQVIQFHSSLYSSLWLKPLNPGAQLPQYLYYPHVQLHQHMHPYLQLQLQLHIHSHLHLRLRRHMRTHVLRLLSHAPQSRPPAQFQTTRDVVPKTELEYTEQLRSPAGVLVENSGGSALMRRASADPASPPYIHNTPTNPRRTEKKFKMNGEQHVFAYYQSTSRSKLNTPLAMGANPGDVYLHYNSSAFDSQFSKTGQMWQWVGNFWQDTTTEYLRTYPEIKHPTWPDRVVYFSPGDNGEPSYVTANWWGACAKKGVAFKGRQRSASLGHASGTPFSSC